MTKEKRPNLSTRSVKRKRYVATLNWWNNPKSKHHRAKGYRYGAKLW